MALNEKGIGRSAPAYPYSQETNPVWARFLLLASGQTPPEIATACEIGFNQGLTLNIHAASENISWHGMDLDPAGAAFSAQLAKLSGAQCLGNNFDEILAASNLPDFDYIAVPQIWNWLDSERQQKIVEFIKRKLKPGGAVYISCNSAPGGAALAPFRKLIQYYIDSQLGAGLDAEAKIRRGGIFAEEFLGQNPAYLKANPVIAGYPGLLKGRATKELAEELLNRGWRQTDFPEMEKIFRAAELDFACSASPISHIAHMALDENQNKFIAGIQDRALREFLLDFMFNNHFRHDYWIKGSQPMGLALGASILKEEKFILLVPFKKLSRQFKTDLGSLEIPEAPFAIITETLKDGKPHSINDMTRMIHMLGNQGNAAPDMDKQNIQTILQALLAFLAAGLAAPALPAASTAKLKTATDKLNFILCQKSIDNARINWLASPVTGGGVRVGRFAQLALLAIRRGASAADAMAAFIRDCLNMANQQIIIDGKPADPASSFEFLQQEVQEFRETSLPLLKNLQIA